MTRDECLGAISAAFDGVLAEAVVGYWNVRVLSTPAREVVLTSAFLERNVFGLGMTQDELTSHIKAIPDTRWARQSDGLMILAL